ncbi:HU family DNA-binding protein [Fusobacterium ulcerans]|uniref:HU family DNA-binding protein n=1 Tax=Fusobacterium ulcerans TaxID=861 RepID=UPI0026F331D1|nr:HU family DNA-binding protein [Fusobacterium ulcerans]
MREEEFIRFYKKERKLKNLKKAKEEIYFFWSVLMEVLKEEKVMFKNWGKFEVKNVKARKVKIPNEKKAFYTSLKKVLSFKCGTGLRERINKMSEKGEING